MREIKRTAMLARTARNIKSEKDADVETIDIHLDDDKTLEYLDMDRTLTDMELMDATTLPVQCVGETVFEEGVEVEDTAAPKKSPEKEILKNVSPIRAPGNIADKVVLRDDTPARTPGNICDKVITRGSSNTSTPASPSVGESNGKASKNPSKEPKISAKEKN